MPKFKVGFPSIVVEAPDEKAALAAYDQFLEGWLPEGLGPEATVVGDVPDYAVDADGYKIAEENAPPPTARRQCAVLKFGCTPSTKHPGRCAECGEPLDTGEEE